MDRIGNRVRGHITIRRPLTGIKWELYHNQSVSNSHSCPKNGVMNWSGNKSLPRSYPGWNGRLWLRYGKDKFHSGNGFGSDMVEGSLTYTGTGGFEHYNGPWNKGEIYSWDYRFFDSDFPKLERLLNIAQTQQFMFRRDKNDQQIHHTYFWEDNGI